MAHQKGRDKKEKLKTNEKRRAKQKCPYVGAKSSSSQQQQQKRTGNPSLSNPPKRKTSLGGFTVKLMREASPCSYHIT